MEVGRSTAVLVGGDAIGDASEPRPRGAGLMFAALNCIDVAHRLVSRMMSAPHVVEQYALKVIHIGRSSLQFTYRVVDDHNGDIPC